MSNNEENSEDKKEEKEKKEGGYPPNPYLYNLQGSLPKSPLRPLPLKCENKTPTPDKIKDKIDELEAISKAYVRTIGDGIDAYWMMTKDLEKRSMYSKVGVDTSSSLSLSYPHQAMKVIAERKS